MNQRFLIIQRHCQHCHKYISAIRKINLRLPLENQIRIIDRTDERFGFNNLSITNFIKWKEFPFLYIDGYVKIGAIDKEDAYYFLYGLLKDELIEEV